MGVSKLAATFFSKVNYSFKATGYLKLASSGSSCKVCYILWFKFINGHVKRHLYLFKHSSVHRDRFVHVSLNDNLSLSPVVCVDTRHLVALVDSMSEGGNVRQRFFAELERYDIILLRKSKCLIIESVRL